MTEMNEQELRDFVRLKHHSHGLKNLRTVSTSVPAARMRVEFNMLMPGHWRYGDLEEAAGAADAGGLWVLVLCFEVCSSAE
jgi:hypothetical protein